MELEQINLREGRRVPEAAEGRKTGVFIVDDEAMVGEVVGIVLGIEGFNTRLFTCPLDALDALETAEKKPDLLITDFAMKPMTGIDLIERCRNLVPSLRTILYSGSLGDHELTQKRGAADALLSKPFLPKELISTVKAVLAA
jgi:two-component system response regulator MtrA